MQVEDGYKGMNQNIVGQEAEMRQTALNIGLLKMQDSESKIWSEAETYPESHQDKQN